MYDNKIKEHPQLWQHLQDMHKFQSRHARTKWIQQLSFSNISQIILETRKIIIEKVTSEIPSNYNGTIIFLIGGTGSGKSTTFCYLRGDKMRLNGFNYESEKDDKKYISDSDSNSETLLPNIEITEKVLLVDFGGFDDSRGELINSGMELALKALLGQYNPAILVLQQITTGGYKSAVSLAYDLSRFIENPKEVCMVGFTKYTQHYQFTRIQSIEEKLSKALSKAEKISTEIKSCEDLLKKSELPRVREILERNQKEFLLLQQYIAEKEEKKEILSGLIKKCENEFLHHSELTQVIRFDDLQYDGKRTIIYNQLLSPRSKPKHKPYLALEPKIEALFINCFMREFVQANVKLPQQKIDTFLALEQIIHEHRFIYAITPPVVSKLLHLPQMNPELVHSLGAKLINEVITNLMDSMKGFNVPLVQKLIEEQHSNIKGSIIHELTVMSNYLSINFTSNFRSEFHLPEWLKVFTYLDAQSMEPAYNLRDKLINNQPVNSDDLEEGALVIKKALNTLFSLSKIEEKISPKIPSINYHVTSNSIFPHFSERIKKRDEQVSHYAGNYS